MRFSSPNSGSTSQNHFKIWQNDPPYKINRQVEEKLSNSVSGCRCDVIIDSKMANLALKCASRVQTRDLPVRITANCGKMISHIKIINILKKIYRIRILTAAVTSLLTQKLPIWYENALLESKLWIYLSESLQLLVT